MRVMEDMGKYPKSFHTMKAKYTTNLLHCQLAGWNLLQTHQDVITKKQHHAEQD